MAQIIKTFELHYEAKGDGYIIKGMISSFDCEEDNDFENSNLEEYRNGIFNVSLICEPTLDLDIFNVQNPVVYIVGYDDQEGQIGLIRNGTFITDKSPNDLVQFINESIWEVLNMNGDSGHFCRLIDRLK